MSWVAQVEWMDEKEFKKFERELVRDPKAAPLSHGTTDLMAVFQKQQRGR